jgi:hypothetical protein
MPTSLPPLDARSHAGHAVQLHDHVATAADLERVCTRAERSGYPLGLVTIALTEVPPAAVAPIARWLAQGVRTADSLVRTGASTLALALAPEDVEHADRVMQRLAGLVADFQQLHPGTGRGEPTISMALVPDALALRTALRL